MINKGNQTKMNCASKCRICAKGSSENLKDIFSSKYRIYLKRIEQIIGMTIEHKNYLPQNICHLCRDDLRQANAFRSRCLRAQRYFGTEEYAEKFKNLNKDERHRGGNLLNKIGTTKSQVDDEKNDANMHLEDENCVVQKLVNEIEENMPNEMIPDDVVCFEKTQCEKNKSEDISKDKLSIVADSKEFNNTAVNSSRKKYFRIRNNFVCDQCGSYYNNSNHFRTHLHKHRGYKPYACGECPSKFYTKSEMKIHNRVHTGIRPYACRYCELSFQTSSTRGVHERMHTNERPYSCLYCEKKFITKMQLTGHLPVHTKERKYSCTICDKDFKRQTHLNVHNRSQTHMQKAGDCKKSE